MCFPTIFYNNYKPFMSEREETSQNTAVTHLPGQQISLLVASNCSLLHILYNGSQPSAACPETGTNNTIMRYTSAEVP